MRERFVIEGLGRQKKLKGAIPVRGAKNAALKFLAASILFEDEVQLSNVPNIEDVARTCELLEDIGAKVERKDSTVTIVPPQKWGTKLETSIAERIRASVVLTGPLLAREGEAILPYPGGDAIGARPIDLFLDGFERMGATVAQKNEQFMLQAPRGLKGAHIFFPFVSVTATETLMMAAILAKGETVLENAAMEPEIVALAEYLKACGAQIEGIGSTTLRIQGAPGKLLHANGNATAILPDRIEAGSFIILAALAGEDVEVTECAPEHLGAILEVLARAGVHYEVGESSVRIRSEGFGPTGRSVSVRTHEYPGFPTDLQAPMTVFLTQTSGESTVLETIFDGRFRYCEELSRMGADITVMNPHRILVRGPKQLSGTTLESPDIRAGLAYLFAAIVATGESVIDNAYVIDRGYERIEERLQKLGLNIRRETSN